MITLFVLVPLLLLLMFGLLIGRTACWILIGLFILFCATHQAHADTADDFATEANRIGPIFHRQTGMVGAPHYFIVDMR